MDRRERQTAFRVVMALIGLVGAGVAVVIGVLVYALLNAPVSALRWWAGVTTIAVPLAVWGGYALGKIVARERLTGLEQGVSTVMKAAEQTANLRVATIREVREVRREPPSPPTHPAQVVIVPATPRLPGGQDVVEV